MVPFYIADYLTPLGLAHKILPDGLLSECSRSPKKQGINIATNCFTYITKNFIIINVLAHFIHIFKVSTKGKIITCNGNFWYSNVETP